MTDCATQEPVWRWLCRLEAKSHKFTSPVPSASWGRSWVSKTRKLALDGSGRCPPTLNLIYASSGDHAAVFPPHNSLRSRGLLLHMHGERETLRNRGVTF